MAPTAVARNVFSQNHGRVGGGVQRITARVIQLAGKCYF
jgi:hypothetical protein